MTVEVEGKIIAGERSRTWKGKILYRRMIAFYLPSPSPRALFWKFNDAIYPKVLIQSWAHSKCLINVSRSPQWAYHPNHTSNPFRGSLELNPWEKHSLSSLGVRLEGHSSPMERTKDLGQHKGRGERRWREDPGSVWFSRYSCLYSQIYIAVSTIIHFISIRFL